MDFKDVGLEDKPVMQPFLINNPYGICDFSFGNLFMWQDLYKTQYCIHKEHLIIRAASRGGGKIYMYPLGNGGKKDILLDMINEAGEFRLGGITPKIESELNGMMPGGFEFRNDTAFCDYVYLSEDLRLLKGRRYNAKRNHINKFKLTYRDRYEYAPIDASIIPQCQEMNERWCRERNCLETGSDFYAVKKALENWDALGLTGGALFAYNELAAFTFGQPNNADTYNIMAEKALKHIDGAYAMINMEFAVRNCEGYMFINREEDMGAEELRKAKLSYRPHLLLTKATGVLR